MKSQYERKVFEMNHPMINTLFGYHSVMRKTLCSTSMLTSVTDVDRALFVCQNLALFGR
ncbi:predicted protein [Nematostella vectensis]|uniref:Uncharacterized protein n=1 Tax=Nematostella vectensis TaxID=45351 RepID=A7RPL6_NEMVE|nr:predicted protein [Nematostella vectensis]|eukprot:XP_001638593.1 predicted protein [Nematostella vectensis]